MTDTNEKRVSLERLRSLVAEGAVKAVLLGFPDMHGRLQGKRCAPWYFVEEVAGHGTGACEYLLSVNVEMDPQSGFPIGTWDDGMGDFVLVPDLDTLRLAGWREDAAICIADVRSPGGGPIEAAPRQVLRRQLDRLEERGWVARAATELEFIVNSDTYAEAWDAGYRDLSPVSRYNVDYSLAGLSQAGSFLERVCESVEASGILLESAKGEANFGQYEINLRYGEAMAAADAHMLFKHTVKEVAAQEGVSATFLAKLNEREGNSCHLHLSIADERGQPLFAAQPELLQQFIAGQLACMGEMTMLFAPNVNSYKRYADRTYAPTGIAWGRDNRTCAIRLVGAGESTRIENRLGGADLNPYVALAAMIAAGLHGIDAGLELPPAEEHDAYAADHPRVPGSLAAAREEFANSEFAREAFGQTVVDHYARAAEIELTEFAAAVTDWELRRGYERL